MELKLLYMGEKKKMCWHFTANSALSYKKFATVEINPVYKVKMKSHTESFFFQPKIYYCQGSQMSFDVHMLYKALQDVTASH